MNFELLAIVLPVISAVLVAVFNNWEKINPSKKRVNDILTITKQHTNDISKIQRSLNRIRSTQKTQLQMEIVDVCKRIDQRIKKGLYQDDKILYSDDLKELIIIYRDYYLLRFNHYGQVYFDDTFEKMKQIYPDIAISQMQSLFPEYDPGEERPDGNDF